jgi:predicted transcriptional regulator
MLNFVYTRRKTMNTSELQLELHQIIDQVKDNRILQAVHTILSSQVSIFAHSTDGKTLSKDDFDKMLEAGEADIKAGRLVSQKDLKEKIKTWRGK